MAVDNPKESQTSERTNRRRYLKLAGAGGIGLLAGCSGSGGGGGGEIGGDNGGGGGGGSDGTTTGSSGSSGDNPVVFGLQAPFTGMPKAAVQEENGSEIAKEWIGEINGRPIKIEYRDTQLKPSRAARNARELISNGADFLAGGISSSVEKAIAEVAGKNETLYIGSDTGSSKLTGEFSKSYYPYYFRPHPSAAMLSKSLAQYAVEKIDMPGQPRVATINPNYTWGKSNQAAFEQKMGNLGNPNYVNKLWPSLGTKQYGPYISKLQSSDPDIVFTALWGGDLVSFLQQANSAGLVDQTNILATSYGVGIANQLQGDAIGGIYTNGQGYWYDLDNDVNNEFRQKYRDEFNKMPPARAAGNFCAMNTIAQAANEAGTVDNTDEIIEYLENNQVNSVYGDIQHRPLDHQAPTDVKVGRTAKGEDPKWLTMEKSQVVPGEDLIRPMSQMKKILCQNPNNSALEETCQNV